MKADLHIHSNNSDGSDSIKDLAQKIEASDLDIFALTDHDTVEGCTEMRLVAPVGKKFIQGVELTSLCGEIKCHILGYGVDIENPELLALIEKGKVLRRKKLETRIQYLKDVWKLDLTKDELNWLYSRKSVVKTHLANILVKRGLASDNVSAMKKYLDNIKTGNTRFDGIEVINTIKNAGGIAVWAHPIGGEGEKHLTEKEFIPKLKTMLTFGIQGLECYYSRYNLYEIKFLVKCANDNNLFISGGSDYHGTNKNIPLGRLNTVDVAIDASKLTLLK